MSGCACCMLPATGCCCRLPVAVAVVATVADISFLFFGLSPQRQSAAAAPHGRRITWHQTGKSFSLPTVPPAPSPTPPFPRPTPALLACQIEARCQNTKQNETYRNRGQRSLPVVAIAVVVVARCVGRVRQNCSLLLPLLLSELLPLLLLPGKLQFSFACCSFSMAPNLCRGTQLQTQRRRNKILGFAC